MSYLSINESQCTRCGACVASCPVSIIDADATNLPFLTTEKEAFCINCFHCEAVCPTQALQHKLSDAAIQSSLHDVKPVSPAELGHYMQNRRSIRQFKSKKIERPVLEQAMEVVRYSPTGTNRQLNQWILISDEQLIQQLASGTIDWMRMVMKGAPEMGNRYNFPALIASWEAGNDRICRNAPHLAICHTPTAHPIGMKDATIAAAHLELYLPSLGIGSCWAGYLMIAIEQSPELKKLIGLTAEQTVHAILMMGFPKYKYQTIPARNKANISWM